LFVEVISEQVKGLTRLLVLLRVGVEYGIAAHCDRFDARRAQRDGFLRGDELETPKWWPGSSGLKG
jgi:hypothetical protein